MPVKGKQQYNLKSTKKVTAAPRLKEDIYKEQLLQKQERERQAMQERTSMRSERSSNKSNPPPKTPPSKKKITASSQAKAKQVRVGGRPG